MISYPGLVKNYAAYFDTPQRKNYLSLGITLVTLIVLIVMVYPAVFYVLDISAQLSANKKVDKLLTEKITALQEAKQNLASLESSLEDIDKALPNNTLIAEYLRDIEQQLSDSQAVISNVNVDETQLTNGASKTGSQLIPVTYTLSLTGNFDNLNQALNKLESLTRFTDITSADFTTQKDVANLIKLSLRAKTYFYGVPETNSKGSR